jgi:hydroxysqualene synthase
MKRLPRGAGHRMTSEVSEVKPPDPTVRSAYRECRRLARHYENFPVASRLVPPAQRDALAAIYVFARTADDFADEPGRGDAEARLALLAGWRAKLRDALNGAAGEPVFIALADAVGRYSLSPANLENLLRAFELDVVKHRHDNFDSLLAYCEYSANPVGRLVLELFGHRDKELLTLSDNICTALQLANFWQDIRVDLERDRLYLPLKDLQRFGISMQDLKSMLTAKTAAVSADLNQRWRRLLGWELALTKGTFFRGWQLPEKVAPQLRRQLRMTWLGGMKILSRIESVDFDVFRWRPKLTRLDFCRLYLKSGRPLPVGAPVSHPPLGPRA